MRPVLVCLALVAGIGLVVNGCDGSGSEDAAALHQDRPAPAVTRVVTVTAPPITKEVVPPSCKGLIEAFDRLQAALIKYDSSIGHYQLAESDAAKAIVEPDLQALNRAQQRMQDLQENTDAAAVELSEAQKIITDSRRTCRRDLKEHD